MQDETFRLTPQQKPQHKLTYAERVKAGITKGGLRPIAKNKIDLHREYEKKKKQDADLQECWAHPKLNDGARLKLPKEFLECHHPNGREGGKNILDYEWCCKTCHRKIHENPNLSRQLGLLNF